MAYDFTTIIDRRGKDALAVDSAGKKNWGIEPGAPKPGYDFLPMWIADMSFATCPSVTEAIIERVQHPVFGYYIPRDEYYASIVDWQTRRNGAKGLAAEHIGYENGVHGFISSVVDTLSAPGDKILLHSPVYVGFAADVEGKGRTSVYSPLVQDEKGIWRMDYADMDKKLKDNKIHLAIFCSPHNPTGRVWERWEIEKAMEVYAANECYVISDEIWADLTYPGYQHIPTQMANDWAREHVAAAYAPSKTFNLAGLTGSYHIIYNKYLRDRIRHVAELSHYNSMNVLSMHALIGAYKPAGHAWLEELRQVLAGNSRYAVEFIRTHFPDIKVAMPQGTYVIFPDCSEYCRRTGQSINEVIQAGWDVGVGWQSGQRFGGPGSIRINLALPFSQVQDAFDRLQKHVFNR